LSFLILAVSAGLEGVFYLDTLLFLSSADLVAAGSALALYFFAFSVVLALEGVNFYYFLVYFTASVFTVFDILGVSAFF